MQKLIFVESINTIILTDFNFWAGKQDFITNWCLKHEAEFKGMIIKLKNSADLSLFLLEL